MTRRRRTRLDDPTAERTTDQSTQSASGLAGGGEGRNRDGEDLIRRTAEERDGTPRRYDQPAEADPVLPSDDSALNTKI